MRKLFLIFTLLLGGAASQFVPDECSAARCGDLCFEYSKPKCHCGNYTFGTDQQSAILTDDQQFCCISSNDTCSVVDNSAGEPVDGFCTNGKVHPMSRHCNNTERRSQCHNSYQDSLVISLDAHYTCPNTCVSVHQEMCRGVNWCGDFQECNEDLRCPVLSVKRILNSSLVPDHYYCSLNEYGRRHDRD